MRHWSHILWHIWFRVVNQDLQDQLVVPDNPVAQENPDNPAKMESNPIANQDQKDHLDNQELQDNQEVTVIQDNPVPQDQLDHPDNPEAQDNPVAMVIQVLMEVQEFPEVMPLIVLAHTVPPCSFADLKKSQPIVSLSNNVITYNSIFTSIISIIFQYSFRIGKKKTNFNKK